MSRQTESYPLTRAKKILPATKTGWPSTLITVGVLTPLNNEAALALIEGISQLLSLTTKITYSILPLTGDNTRLNLFEQTKEAIPTCNVLVTYGVTCANIATEACKLIATIPLIKVGLRRDQLIRLMPGLEDTFILVTEYDYMQQAKLFKQLKPHAKTVCIMYRNNTENSAVEVAHLREALHAVGLTTFTHLLIHSTHIDNQISALNIKHDTIFLMQHTITAKNIQELVTYCIAKRITLCTQELDLVTLGATLGFGGHAKELGVQSAHLIRDLFEGRKKNTNQTIISYTPNYRCLINKAKCELQDIVLTAEYINLLEQTILINQPILTTLATRDSLKLEYKTLRQLS